MVFCSSSYVVLQCPTSALLYTHTASRDIPILLHIQYTIDSKSEVRPSMLCVCTCQPVLLVLRSRDAPSVPCANLLVLQPFHPVCLRIWSAFSFLGSGSNVRFLRAASRRSRAICLDCLGVGRRMAQLSWPKMLVLIATDTSQYGSHSVPTRPKHTIHTVWAQQVRPLHPPTCRALGQRCDILESFASHEPLSLLAVRRLLLRHRLEQAIPSL
jgi:hypothetical protein